VKPRRSWTRKFYLEGVACTCFIFAYPKHIEWTLHEDAPWKDTVETQLIQSYDEFRQNGMPGFIRELLDSRDASDILITLKNLIL
jgi:hypothetical protein